MMSFNHSAYLEPNYIEEEALPGLLIELGVWNEDYPTIFKLRNGVVRAVFDGEAPTRKKSRAVDGLLTLCSNILSNVDATAEVLPPNVAKERGEYVDMLTTSIDMARDVSYNNDPEILRVVEEVVSGVLDLYDGLNTGYTILEKGVDSSHIERENTRKLRNVSSYYSSFEQDRASREHFPLTNVLTDKRIGMGKKLGEFRTAELVGGLFEYLEPKQYLLDMNPGQIVEMRRVIEEQLNDYVSIRDRFSKKLENKLGLRRVLLQEEDVMDMLLSQIKPRSPYDLIAGRSLQHELRGRIMADKELLGRVNQLIEIYMVRIPGRHCSQAAIYDILWDVVIGDPRQVLWHINLYQTQLGFPPLPGYEKLMAKDVINPNPEERFNLKDIVPQLSTYSSTIGTMIDDGPSTPYIH